FERARLIAAGKERLAAKIEHASRSQGDGAGFDILSFDATGAERLFGFQVEPRLFALAGPLSTTCRLSASSYLATVA
ncbi:MAG: hypothetical protein KGJ25_01095, partial [Betaproteobacteria bacterium]|nr:hypothetical protein [Betaproteobacteria bacterium]